jgi:hypothetical protein
MGASLTPGNGHHESRSLLLTQSMRREKEVRELPWVRQWTAEALQAGITGEQAIRAAVHISDDRFHLTRE